MNTSHYIIQIINLRIYKELLFPKQREILTRHMWTDLYLSFQEPKEKVESRGDELPHAQ